MNTANTIANFIARKRGLPARKKWSELQQSARDLILYGAIGSVFKRMLDTPVVEPKVPTDV